MCGATIHAHMAQWRWLRRLDDWGRVVDLKWARWLEARIAPQVEACASFVVLYVLPAVGMCALAYLLLRLVQ